jgi:hypothetical protein
VLILLKKQRNEHRRKTENIIELNNRKYTEEAGVAVMDYSCTWA